MIAQKLAEIRFRYLFLVIGSVLALVLWIMTDPDAGMIKNLPFGSKIVTDLSALLRLCIFIGYAFLARKALFDYIDLETYFKKALQSAEGAGMAIIGVSITFLGLCLLIGFLAQ